MSNYAAVVARAADWLPRPLALCGWSMGGLAAMLAARVAAPDRLVLLEPSPPGEVQGFEDRVVPTPGTFDPEAAYGPFPPGIRARTESAFARGERRRGVSVPALDCPTLVVFGDQYADERGRAVARRYGADERHIPGLDHWGLVRDPQVPRAVSAWLWRSSRS
jgi:pimeloyl-ACP methyl ester carboxylesterase